MGLMLSGIVKKNDKDYKNNGNVKWNFTKFLIDRNGEIAARFEPTDMKNLKTKIEACLQYAGAEDQLPALTSLQ